MGALGVDWGYTGDGYGSLDSIREEARWATSAGFDSFWLPQVFHLDPLVTQVALAADTGDMEVGTSVQALPGRHPFNVAAQALTAQAALDGRFTLGVGPSHQMVAEGMYGEAYDKPFTRTREFLDALLPLMSGEAANVDGETLTARGKLDLGVAAVPVMVAALGERMLDLAGRRTAGTQLGGCGPKTIASHIVPTITAAAEAAGRPKPRIQAYASVGITHDPDRLRAHAAPGFEIYARLPAYRAVLDREGVDSPLDLLLAGSPEQVVAGLEAYVAAGATELRVGIHGVDSDEIAMTRDFLAGLLHA